MFNDRSFAYNKNNNVSEIESCGIPYIIFMSEDVYLYRLKFLPLSWLISSKYER